MFSSGLNGYHRIFEKSGPSNYGARSVGVRYSEVLDRLCRSTRDFVCMPIEFRQGFSLRRDGNDEMTKNGD